MQTKFKKYIIWGLILWLGGGILGWIFRLFSEVSRNIGAILFFGGISILLGFGAIFGFILLIIGIVKWISGNTNRHRNVRIARRVKQDG